MYTMTTSQAETSRTVRTTLPTSSSGDHAEAARHNRFQVHLPCQVCFLFAPLRRPSHRPPTRALPWCLPRAHPAMASLSTRSRWSASLWRNVRTKAPVRHTHPCDTAEAQWQPYRNQQGLTCAIHGRITLRRLWPAMHRVIGAWLYER